MEQADQAKAAAVTFEEVFDQLKVWGCGREAEATAALPHTASAVSHKAAQH